MSEGSDKLEALEARLAKLASAVRAELPERARALRGALQALERGEDVREAIQRLAHKVRGTAGSHGMTSLTEPAAAVESAAREGPIEVITQLGRALADALDQTAKDAPTAVAPRAQTAPSTGLVKLLAGRSVLAIDDDPATRRLLGMTLANLGGATASIEETPTAFFEALAARPYDAIIVDAMMPEMNGLACLKRIAGSPLARPNARYFVLSAAAPEELRWELPSSLAAAWLRKPFRPRDLLEALESALAA